MRDALPKAIIDSMHEKYIYEAMRREGTIKDLPAYVEGSYYLPESCVEQLKQLSQEEMDALIGRIISTAQYLYRTSPAALRLILDDRAEGHLNAFVRIELAGLEVYLVWARHLMRWLRSAGVVLDHGCSSAGFKTQLSWLSDVDCMFPASMAMPWLQMRRKFVTSKELVGKRDLYEYIKLPENEIFGFGSSSMGDEDPSLMLERRNVCHAMYISTSKDMVFDTLRDIVRSNGSSHSLASPSDW